MSGFANSLAHHGIMGLGLTGLRCALGFGFVGSELESLSSCSVVLWTLVNELSEGFGREHMHGNRRFTTKHFFSSARPDDLAVIFFRRSWLVR